MYISPSGFNYGEYYLYAQKQWDAIPSGVIDYVVTPGFMQNAPVIITSSGLQETQPGDPFARYDGLGKYKKVGFGNFTGAQKEFALNPAYNGYIVFAYPLTENVYVEYESSSSSYYTLTSMDLNPMRNDFITGFISFSNETEPVSINMSATNVILTSDGFQKTNILATMLDENNDPCPNQQIIFSIADAFISYLVPIDGTITGTDSNGNTTQVTCNTNGKGQARVQYWPEEGKSGAQVVIASLGSNRNIFGYIVITQEYTLGNPFTLDVSLLDSTDYLT